MKQPSSAQVLAASAVVALLAAWSMIGFYSSTEDAAGGNADVYKIGEQASRFQDLMSALPPGGMVGYVSDVPPSQTLSAVLYSGLQYTLAPRLVTNQNVNPPPEFVIGDFSKPLDVVQFGKAHGLILVKDFGNGAVLYRAELHRNESR
jgi:hypothetical protein